MKRILTFCLLQCALCTFLIGAQAATRFSYYYQQSEKAYEKKDYETSLLYLERGVRENPKDGPCWAVMAEIYSKRAFARYAEALEASETALKLLKKDKSWCAFLYNVRGDVYYKIGDLAQSEQCYRMSLRLNPSVDGYISLGDVLREEKKYAECIDVFTRVIDMHPDYTYMYAELADACLLQGDLDAAERNARLAVYLSDGDNVRSHVVLSRLALQRKQVPMACSELAKACFADAQMDTDFDSVYHLYPQLLDAAMLNEYETRRNDLQANTWMTVYHFATQRYADAVYYVHHSVTDDSQASLALMYYYFGNYERAIRYAQSALRADSTNASLCAYLAKCYGNLGDYQQAVDYHLRAARLYSSSSAPADVYRHVARRYFQMQDFDRAIRYVDSAIMLSDAASLPVAMFNRGELYRLMGREQEALADLHEAQRMLASSSDRTTACYVLALLGERAPVDQYVDSVTTHLSTVTDYEELINLYACLRDKDQTIRYIDFAREHGMRFAQSLRHNFRLQWLLADPDFEAAMLRMEQAYEADLRSLDARLSGHAEDESATTEIPFTVSGGVNQVRCQINGLPLYFVFDTGASDVTISSVEANFMLKNGYLTDADFMGKQNYVTASGDIHEGTIVNLREVRVGDITLTNIQASVISGQHAPLLLGQTVFRRFGTLEVDNQQHIIIFRK